MNALSERAKLGLLCFLLLLMLGILALTAVNTYRAVQSFQNQNSELQEGDVSTIHSWMTIHVISHIYHVPEVYLEHTLQINSPEILRHATLNQIAGRKRQPVTQVIRTLQNAILTYRKQHPQVPPTPEPTQHTGIKPRAPTPTPKTALYSGTKLRTMMPGRTKY